MNLYSNKQRWKMLLIALAVVIVAITLWYSNHIASQIEKEEKNQIELWSRAIKKRAQLVEFTEKLFEQLKTEEKKDAEFFFRGYSILTSPKPNDDLSFATDFVFSNTNIPILIYDIKDSLILSKNLPEGKNNDIVYTDSLKYEISLKNQPLLFKEVGWKVYYNDSYLFTELQQVMDDLINSFISETVINSASVPVLLMDSTKTNILKHNNIDITKLNNPKLIAQEIKKMASENEPIAIVLPGLGKQYIYYENSLILRQLKYFPVIQLILIGVFLLGSYLIFSTFRKAEQNQVWVGMAKETAHQLGTPLSSLMAWVSILETMGVDQSTITEIDKDVKRLEMITERFSKIGSKPNLKPENMHTVIQKALDYLAPRVSTKVKFTLKAEEDEIYAMLSKPLFGWVLENLIKNAVDAMEGQGKLDIHISQIENDVMIDITDTGKGIDKTNLRTVFEPGFTTKKRGWGLGLSLTKRIIESYHQGRIFVLSSTSEGTVFRIILTRGE